MRTAPITRPGDCLLPERAGDQELQVDHPCDARGPLREEAHRPADGVDEFPPTVLEIRHVANLSRSPLAASRHNPTGLFSPVVGFYCAWTFSHDPAGQ
jgi:hypothetical protein